MAGTNGGGHLPRPSVAAPDFHPKVPTTGGRGTPSHGRGRPFSFPSRRFCCGDRSEEHTSELQSLMRISYAVFCLKKKTNRMSTSSVLSTDYHNNTHMQSSIYSTTSIKYID